MAARRGPILKKGNFTCENCNISTPYHSFGRSHPFTGSFVLLEEAYVARDPFSPSPRPLVVGSHCCNCSKLVCVGSSCSIFYCKRFCVQCVQTHPQEFPVQILQEMSSSYSISSWHMTAVSVLAGVGAGYLIGLLTTKWLWQRKVSTSSSSLSLRHECEAELAAAISGLTSEVGLLRAAMAENQQGVGQRSRHAPTETTADFVSALGETPGDVEDEFFDINEGEGSEIVTSTLSPQQNFKYLDQVGKSTLESEAFCLSLLEDLKGLLKDAPEETGLLWRQARALVHLSMHHEQKNEKERELGLLVEAAEVAQKALELDGEVWQSHQWYAVAVGSQAKHQGTQKKIITGHEYKDHIDIAVSLHDSEPTLYHLRGKWYYEVAGVSWLERKAAAALYATPPQATYTDALEDFMKVEQLTPGVWKSNLLMVAKCHIKLGNVSHAVEWLQKSSDLPVVTTEDKTAQNEVEELLAIHLQQ